MKRIYLSESVNTLAQLFDATNDQSVINAIAYELGFRKSKAAQRLRTKVEQGKIRQVERIYLSESINTLTQLFDETSDQSVINAIAHELGFRKSKAAQRLRTKVEQGKIIRTSTEPQTSSAGRPVIKRPNFKPPAFKLTHEQEKAIDAFLTGEDVKIIAFAGAGKTSTLSQMSNRRDGKGLYLAFNRSIADEARAEFPRYVDCRTTHSVASRAVRGSNSGYTGDKLFKSFRAKMLAEYLANDEDVVFDKELKIGKLQLNAVDLAFLSQKTITHFCQSGDASIGVKHVKKIGKLAKVDNLTFIAVAKFISMRAQEVWSKMVDPTSDLPLGHDGYLKLWSLSNPNLNKDFVLLDEAQDTNPCVSHVIGIQKNQNIIVGDSHQQIYAWRGAEDAMQTLQASKICYLSQSFRFGDGIAEVADKLLKALGESQSLSGNPSVKSIIVPDGDADVILARSNAMVITELMHSLETGKTPHIIGGVAELLQMVGDVFQLKKSQPATHADFFGFNDWYEVVEFANSDEGESLVMFVNLVNKFGECSLYSSLKRVVDQETEANVVISTAHKAKGRQWSSVKIADDFDISGGDLVVSEDEMRLFYVSITRAKNRLIIDPKILQFYSSAKVQFGGSIKKPRAIRTPKPKSAVTPEPKKAPAPKPKAIVTLEPKAAPAPKSKAVVTPEPKAAPVPKPKAIITPDPKAAPVSKPKVVVTPEPKVTPLPMPKSAVTPESKNIDSRDSVSNKKDEGAVKKFLKWCFLRN